jgi:hypothetical protein
MMIMRKWTTRRVFLTKRHALKLPRLRPYAAWKSRSWRSMLEGFHANLMERRKWQQSSTERRTQLHLCPILLSDSLGLFVIMPYARPLTDEEFAKLWEESIELESPFAERIHTDFKRENYGMLGDCWVKVDYEIEAPNRR